jgi:hypothetical protein
MAQTDSILFYQQLHQRVVAAVAVNTILLTVVVMVVLVAVVIEELHKEVILPAQEYLVKEMMVALNLPVQLRIAQVEVVRVQ